MIYLIDGHNLIPQLQGISLQDIDDEDQLIHRLEEHLIGKRGKMEIYFDGAAPGFGRIVHTGRITIRFVARPNIADDAMIFRLQQIPIGSQNYIVITSDRRILAEANARKIKTMRSHIFAHTVMAKTNGIPAETATTEVTEEEIDHWMRIFTKDRL